MKISVVTAVRNRKETIGAAIASLRAQTHADIEHVIQDGASDDGTLEVIAREALPATRLVSEPDGGIYDAINRGITRATGDVIGLLHSDDMLAHKQVLERVAETLERTGADGVYGDLEYVSARDPGRRVRHWRSGEYHPGLLRRGWMPPHPTLYLRREVYERWGGYDTGFRICADYDAMLRYLVKGGIRLAYIPEVLVRMRLGGASNRSLATLFQTSREDYRAMRRNGVGGLGTVAAKKLRKIGQFF
jgi:glycosyltransferase